MFKWYAGAWFFFTINMAILGLAFGSYFWLSPQLDQTLMWDFSWVSLIFLRNFVLFVIVAGGLHLWFHTYAVQGQDKKYDPRPFPRKGRMFSFNSQVLDNMFWSLASGVTIWSGFEVLLWWALSNGFAPLTTFAQTPVWFIAFFFFVPVWESFYFYWIHRLLHSNLLYRFHALHHRNTDVGPWSGLSMHPLEHLMFFGTVAIHFVLPTHPVHVIFHLMYYALYAVTTHTGFEGLWFRNLKRVHLGMFHHQIHHRYFEVNYGSLDVPWDKVFGSFHDGTPEGKARMKERLRSRKR
ncbi:sterol desaturase family protein [Sulfitobacter mediterraneus]|uniref:sterol desaturase family protein n=1 Tax=Sulfitobacter mediterraneus TaxID=83219 RepID=UPI000ACD2BA1|nr:sterol desaturase family protein [Sulfitobacter mediterraneus]